MSKLIPYIQKIDVETHKSSIYLFFDTSFIPISLNYDLINLSVLSHEQDISKNSVYSNPLIIDNLKNGDIYSIRISALYSGELSNGEYTEYSEPSQFIPYDLSAITSPLVLSIDLSGTPGFLMAAENAPDSTSLNSNLVNIIFMPQQPSILFIEPSNGCIIIHIDKSQQYYTSLNYVYDVNGMGQQFIFDNSLSTITIPNLRNGVRYKIKLHAFKNEFASEIVETDYFIPRGNPFPPIIETAYHEGTQLNVKFKPAYNGGNGFPTVSYLWSINSTDNFLDISFLAQQLVQYPDLITEPAVLRMKSVNLIGLVSLDYSEYKILFQPSKPIISKIVAGDSRMWIYLVESTRDMQYRFSFNGGSQQMCEIVDASCLLISGLQNGLAHKVRIIKYNGVLFSPPSDESDWVGIGLAPNKLVVKAAGIIAGALKIHAVSEIEGANGGIQIDGYKYSINEGEYVEVGILEYEMPGVISDHFTVNGILPGKHTIRIIAYNAYGESRPSQLKYIATQSTK